MEREGQAAAASLGDGGSAEPGPEEEADEEEETEGARVAKRMLDTGALTTAEREAHEATHLLFRVLCPECVAGRRTAPAHSQ